MPTVTEVAPTATTPEPRVTAAPPTEPVTTPTVDLGTATPTGPTNRTSYNFDVVLDYSTRSLSAVQIVDFPNNTGEIVTNLVFIVEPIWTAEVFELESVEILSGPGLKNYTIEKGALILEFLGELLSGESVEIKLIFNLKIPDRPGKLGFSNRQVNIGDWYPFIPVYDEKTGWIINQRAYVGETLVFDLADFQMQLQIMNMPEELQLAASVPYEVDGNQFLLSGAAYRNLVLSMSDRYESVREQVGAVEVVSYFFPAYQSAGVTALKTAVQSIEVFSELFGPYPHEKYTIVSGNFPDGLEYDGLTYVSTDYYYFFDGTEQTYLVLLTAHEAAHQWWYGLIGSNSAREPWLDEALSTYSELLYLEAVAPELTDWWWAYRIDPFRPLEGNVDDAVYDHAQFRPYVNAVYLRGAEFLHAVREEMGDEDFYRALSQYANSYRGGFTAGKDLIGLFDSISEDDLNEIWAEYLSDGNQP